MADDEAFRRAVLAMGPVIGSRITFWFLVALASIATVAFVAILVTQQGGFFAPLAVVSWSAVMVSWLVRGSYRLITATTPDP